jgi:Tat protein secretion system quality control protein TatD with DNase activity
MQASPFCSGFHSFTMTVLYHPVKDCSSSVPLSQMVPEVDYPFLAPNTMQPQSGTQ